MRWASIPLLDLRRSSSQFPLLCCEVADGVIHIGLRDPVVFELPVPFALLPGFFALDEEGPVHRLIVQVASGLGYMLGVPSAATATGQRLSNFLSLVVLNRIGLPVEVLVGRLAG